MKVMRGPKNVRLIEVVESKDGRLFVEPIKLHVVFITRK
jgi:hypothetical protein